MSHDLDPASKSQPQLETPSVQEARSLVHPEKKPVKYWSRPKQAIAALGIAVAASGGTFFALKASGDHKNNAPVPDPKPTAEAPVIPGEQKPTPNAQETEVAPQEKTWEALEVPEADSKGFRDFGSKEAFLDWFKIDAETYNTPELIAQKYVQDIEGIYNASLTYQFDENTYKNQPDGGFESTAQNIENQYLTPIYDELISSDANITGVVDPKYLNEIQEGFWITYMNPDRYPLPYIKTTSYKDSSILAGSIDSGLVTIAVSYSDDENTTSNFANERRSNGEAGEYINHLTENIDFELDRASGKWKITASKLTDSTRDSVAG